MNAIILLISYHHQNTEKIAKVIANTIGAEIKKPQETDLNTLQNYDLIGFGSGIYYGKPDKNLLETADKIPTVTGKKAFIFSTSGRLGNEAKFHKGLREKLQSKGFTIIGEFNCGGYDTFGLLKIGGGVNKGKPNEEDVKAPEAFAQNLKQQMTNQ